MLLLTLLACAKTDGFPAPVQPVAIKVDRESGPADNDGRACNWEEESLWVGGTRLLGSDAPDGNTCGGQDDHWQTVNVLFQNGRFYSVEREWGACCPERRQSELLTWDVEAGRAVSIVDYDEKWGEKRLSRARKAVERGRFPGLADPNAVDPSRFYIAGAHVVFVATDALGHRVEIPVP